MVLNFIAIKKIVISQCGGNLSSLTNHLDPSCMVAAADEDRRKSEFAKLELTKYIFPYCLFSP